MLLIRVNKIDSNYNRINYEIHRELGQIILLKNGKHFKTFANEDHAIEFINEEGS